MRKFIWRDGFPGSNLDADRIGAELQTLQDLEGVVRADDVLKWARLNPDSELHKAIEWDDAIAADKYRRYEITDLIGAIRHYEVGGGEIVIHRTNFSIGGGQYITEDGLRKNAEYRQEVLSKAIRSLESWASRYQEVLALCDGVEVTVADTVEKLQLLRAAEA